MRSMRHAAGALTVLLVLAGTAAGQQSQQSQQQQSQSSGPVGIVNGAVTDATTGRPLVGAQVHVVGFKIGGVTGPEGRFTIPGVPAGRRVVRLEMLGFGTTERIVNVTENGTVSLDLAVFAQAIAVDQVVVTALGVQQQQRSLGFAVQSIERREIERGAPLTLVGAIAGHTAGTHIVESSGQPGGSARIALRGEASVRGDGQPLYIIDGVPIFSEIDPNGYDPLSRGQAGSRLIDIDPVNIEEISVLRSAAATALYGSRAALGAIVIRTRQGTPGSPLRVSFNSRVGFEEPILEGLQTSWAAGSGGYYCSGAPVELGGWCDGGVTANPAANQSWGPHRDSIPSSVTQRLGGQVGFRDPRSDFFRTGKINSHSIYGTGSVASGTYALGFGYANHEGIMTKSKLDRLNLISNVSVNMKPNLVSQTTVVHTNTVNDLGWEGQEGFGALVSVMPPSRNLVNAWNEDGTPVMFGTNDPHPQWLAENEYATSRTVRWIASQMFAWSFGPSLTLSNRTGFDQFVDERREFQNERPWLTASGQPSGGTRQQKLTQRVFNNDLVLSAAQRPIGDRVGFTGLAGLNLFHATKTDISAWGLNMNIPGFYTLSNFTTRYQSALLPTERRLIGAYVQGTFDYDDWAYLTLSGRNDWSSTLPLGDNAYFSPAASLAVIFTDALGWQSTLLDYGKVRLSIAKVGADAPPYRLRSVYQRGDLIDWSSGTGTATTLTFPFRGVKGVLESTELGNPNLEPETMTEAELGLELHWFSGRARTDVSLYNRSSRNQIFSVPAAPATGFTLLTENAGDLTNRGIEVSVGLSPIRTASTSLEIRGNVARNWSKVDELADGVSYIYLAGIQQAGLPQVRIVRGEPYGAISGSAYQRDDQGRLLIGPDGWPLVAQDAVIGNAMPTLLGNVNASLTHRAITVSGLLDFRRGGQIANVDLANTIPQGTAQITEHRNDQYTFAGVNAATGQPNTVQLVRDEAFWQRYATVNENLIESANVARLREVTLSVTLPESLSRRLDANALTAYVTGTNVGVWSPYSYGDPTGSNYGSANAGGAAYRLFTTPTTRRWSFGVRASF